MSLPDKCPFCGAARKAYWPGVCYDYTCGTSIHTKRDARRNQSHTCKEAERATLAARVAELEERCKRLEEAGDAIVDEYMVVEPEKSAWKQAKEAKP